MSVREAGLSRIVKLKVYTLALGKAVRANSCSTGLALRLGTSFCASNGASPAVQIINERAPAECQPARAPVRVRGQALRLCAPRRRGLGSGRSVPLRARGLVRGLMRGLMRALMRGLMRDGDPKAFP